MATDQQLIESVRRADPVPDLDRLPGPRLSAMHLVAGAGKEPAMKTLTPRDTNQQQPKQRRPWARPLLAFGLALVITIAAIASVALLTRGGDSTPAAPDTTTSAPTLPATTLPTTAATPTTVTPDTSPATSTTPPTTEAPPTFAGEWTAFPADFGASAVQATDLGFVATSLRSVWLSTDGSEWQVVLETPFEALDPQPGDLLPGEPPLGRIESFLSPAIIEADGTVQVFGSVATNPHTSDRVVEHFVWSTEDGNEWARTSLPAPDTEPIGGIRSAAVSGNITVATLDSDHGTLIVTARDGDWTAIEPMESGLEQIGLSDVIAYDDGFVAIGEDSSVDETAYPWGLKSLYASSDGSLWQRVEGSDFAFGEFPTTTIAVDGDTVYVGGSTFVVEGSNEAAMWMSTDGAHFEPVDLDPVVAGRWGFLTGLLPSDRGLLAMAWLGVTEDSPSDIVILVGDDVTDLAVMDAADGFFADADFGVVAYDGERIIILGALRTADEWIPYRWTWTASS